MLSWKRTPAWRHHSCSVWQTVTARQRPSVGTWYADRMALSSITGQSSTACFAVMMLPSRPYAIAALRRRSSSLARAGVVATSRLPTGTHASRSGVLYESYVCALHCASVQSSRLVPVWKTRPGAW